MFELRRTLASALALLALLAAGAAGAAEPPRAWHGDLASARAFMADVARLYELKYRGKLQIKAVNTVAALEMLHQGRTDLVASARPADPRNPGELELAFVPVAWDGLAMIVHPSNPVRGLSLRQLHEVMSGRVTDWSQLGGAPKPINLYAVAGPLDGVEFALRRLLFGNGAAAVAARRWYITTQQLEEAIAIDPSGLGVTLMSNVHANKALRPLAIEGVLPTHVALERGEYLLATPLYVVARRAVPGQDPTLDRARRALEFIDAEPAIKAAMRRKQLVPMAEARALNDSREARERFIVTTLDIKLPGAAPVIAGPPAPRKDGVANTPRVSGAASVARTALAPAAQGQANALRGRDPTRREDCRPAAVCD